MTSNDKRILEQSLLIAISVVGVLMLLFFVAGFGILSGIIR